MTAAACAMWDHKFLPQVTSSIEPVTMDHLLLVTAHFWQKGAVFQDRFYCTCRSCQEAMNWGSLTPTGPHISLTVLGMDYIDVSYESPRVWNVAWPLTPMCLLGDGVWWRGRCHLYSHPAGVKASCRVVPPGVAPQSLPGFPSNTAGSGPREPTVCQVTMVTLGHKARVML